MTLHAQNQNNTPIHLFVGRGIPWMNEAVVPKSPLRNLLNPNSDENPGAALPCLT